MTSANAKALRAEEDSNAAEQLHEFFKNMFGTHPGYIYAPVTEPKNAQEAEHNFFRWPEQASGLVDYVIHQRAGKEVYFSPVLFKKPELSENELFGTKYIWAEFNGELPDKELVDKVPTPSFKLRTSREGHEYWFWQLQYFEKNVSRVHDLVQRISFHLKADLSSWDYDSVFRPPSTIHHRSGNITYIFDNINAIHSIEAFHELPAQPKYLTEDNFTGLPLIDDVVATNLWTAENWKFFKKKQIPEGKRFQALTRLANCCAEMGMKDKEILAILINADTRWGHFSDRNPEKQKRKLIALINHVRLKKPLEAYRDTSKDYPFFNFADFMATSVSVEWALEPFVEKQGMTMITGDSGIGKTRFNLDFCIHMALGKDWLGWKCPKPMKMQFWSLEMNHGQLKRFLEFLTSKLTKDELQLLKENFFPIPIGHSVHLDKASQHDKANRLLDMCVPDGLVIDSFGVAVQDDIEKSSVVNPVFEYVNREVRQQREAFVVWIHHHRKHGTNKPVSDDMFGSVYIKNQMTGIFTLHRIKKDPVKGDIYRVLNQKQRLTEELPEFKIRTNTDTIGYSLYDGLGLKNSTSAKNDDDDETTFVKWS
jgi:hypothetical protein